MQTSFYISFGYGNSSFSEDALPHTNKGLMSGLHSAAPHTGGSVESVRIQDSPASFTSIGIRFDRKSETTKKSASKNGTRHSE